MEIPKSTPHCSFVVYLNQDEQLIPDYLRDVRSFFKKFPLSYELVFILEKGPANERLHAELAAQKPQSGEELSLHRNTKKWGRAASLRQGLNLARGQILIIADPAMATPLGDLFKLIQNLSTEPSMDLIWGERLSKGSSALREPKTPRHRLESLFNRILSEKHPILGADPLCEAIVIKKESWEKLEKQLPKLSDWYLAPDLRNTAHRLKLQTLNIFVHDFGGHPPSFKLWPERWNLLKKSLF